MHNNDVLFEFFDGVSNHCASDRANNSSISAVLFPCIIIMSSACTACTGMAAVVDDQPWPRLMSN